MSEKKQLTDEELEKVTGGYIEEFTIREHDGRVSSDEAKNYIGSCFYVVSNDDQNKWAMAQLQYVNALFGGGSYRFDVKETPEEKDIQFAHVIFRRGKVVNVMINDVTLFLESKL